MKGPTRIIGRETSRSTSRDKKQRTGEPTNERNARRLAAKQAREAEARAWSKVVRSAEVGGLYRIPANAQARNFLSKRKLPVRRK
jgi:hypothetical protein